MEVTLKNDREIPNTKRQSKNCSEDVTRTLAMDIRINNITLIIVTFLRPYLPEI
jgi:hypothetical protein